MNFKRDDKDRRARAMESQPGVKRRVVVIRLCDIPVVQRKRPWLKPGGESRPLKKPEEE